MNHCLTCRFYDGDEGGGLCRAHPPVVIVPDDPGAWPHVSASDWCGTHEWGTRVPDGNPFEDEGWAA